MPHANIWIRKENEDLWNSLSDKSAWVNNQLAQSPSGSLVELGAKNGKVVVLKENEYVREAGVSVSGSRNGNVNVTKRADAIVQPSGSAMPAIEQQPALVEQATSAFESKTCKNGHRIPAGRERCLGKGCKYSL